MIKEWLEKRRKEDQEKSYRDGFGWVMTHYYLDKASLDEIEECLSNDFQNHFDYGGLAALKILKEN